MTAAQMGHRSTEMIFQHYRELVPKKETERFWQLMPGAQAENAGQAADMPEATRRKKPAGRVATGRLGG
jgi:hypothetical protein